MNTSIAPSNRSTSGFSFIEVLFALIIVALIAGSGYIFAGRITHASKLSKLEVDVSSLNQSINVYLASGGNLDGVTQPQLILDKLKTVRTQASAERFSGLRSSMVDKRLYAVMMTSSESLGSTPRALWDSAEKSFQIATTGTLGVKHFALDDSLTATDYGTENREASPIDVNPNDGWLWAYSDSNVMDAPAPTLVSVSPTPSSGSGSSSGSSSSSGSDGGSGDSSSPPGDSGDGGSGSDDGGYDGPPPPQQLSRPQIYPTTTNQPASSYPLTVTLHDYNPSGVSELQYRVAGPGADDDGWLTYNEGFEVLPDQTVSARSVTLDPTTYITSSTRDRTYRLLADRFAASGTPVWTNVAGGDNLLYDVSGASNQTMLTHGNTQILVSGGELNVGTANTLNFVAENYDVSPNQEFVLGNLTYFNGSTFNQSDADTASLEITFDFTEPTPSHYTVRIPVQFLSSPNSDDPYESADSVVLRQQWFGLPRVNGVNYYLYLRFGTPNDGGFGTNTSLNAFEGAQAEVEVIAKFYSN